MDDRLYARLAVIEQVALRLEERLFGNGQPGEIALLKERVHQLEMWFWRAAGAGALLVLLIELFHPAVVR